MKNIKRILSVLLLLSMLFLVACSKSDKDDKDSSPNNNDPTIESTTADPTQSAKTTTAQGSTEIKPSSKLLLPEKMVFEALDGNRTELNFAWSENTCEISFTGVDLSLKFVYDPTTRALDYTETRIGESRTIEGLCVFDDQGRFVSMNAGEDDTFDVSYDSGKVIMTSYPFPEINVPADLQYNSDAKTIRVPKSSTEEHIAHFNENGDVYMLNDNGLFQYTYDDNGNIVSIGSEIEIIYGTQNVTSAWQNVPARYCLYYSSGVIMLLFAMNMICISMA